MADNYNGDWTWDNEHDEYLRGYCHASRNFTLYIESWDGWDETIHHGERIFYQLDREEE